MKLTRKYNETFIGGHLLEHTSMGVEYPVIARSARRAGLLIIDDLGKEVWVSSSCLRKHFIVIRK
ncbi:hypothetical protein P13BB106kb_p057 [Pectobacterium phage DU_PP_V]|uniref:Uncharacterized protein n=1 Tax=Pectobacterium phage DU_PP_V TaxID=2041492 RepID=A0A2D2W6W4_9CAUD|nr:hypothetical protein HOS40_gp112 [Pectobacterium phage DU_PP_V]ATS94041.1 hypothetical protein P13BB106kb_p057 [Pectobacterium phage DU_PP_V]